MVDSLVFRFFLAVGLVFLTIAVAVLATTVTASAAVVMLVINTCGGHVSYGVCVLASLASHIALIGGYIGLEWLMLKMDARTRQWSS